MSEINPPDATSEPPSDALESLRSAAETGDPRAQYALGMCHANGDGVPLNYVAAAEWFERAATQGLAEAQTTLAWLYASGFGVDQSDERAGHWYLQAARQGLASAQYTVAGMYRWGRYGVARNSAEALVWFRRAAEQNLAPAQLTLGRLLAEGREVPAEPVAAFQWLTLAILHGSEPAKQALAELSGRMSPAQVEQAKSELLARMGG